MQFRFKNQKYQEDATLAVVSVFQGQPKNDAYTYLFGKGLKALHKGMESLFEDSYAPWRATGRCALCPGG